MARLQWIFATTVLVLALFTVACAGPAGASLAAAPTATPAPAAQPASAPTKPAATTGSSAQPVGSARYDVATSGTEASFSVREQLARLNAPSDAVGKTSSVTGAIVIGSDGKIVADQSKFTIDLSTLTSDSSMRDGFIKGRTLETSTYPTAVFVPKEIQGLATPLPTSGQQSFKLLGDLTIHGVTKPVTWDVTGQANNGDLTGQASTNVKFEDFGMTQPKVASVLSVNDDIKLGLTFHLVKAN